MPALCKVIAPGIPVSQSVKCLGNIRNSMELSGIIRAITWWMRSSSTVKVIKCMRFFFTIVFSQNNLGHFVKAMYRKLYQEYVASIIGVYKNNGAVSCVANYFPCCTELTYQIYLGISHGVTFNLIPNYRYQ